MSRFIFASLGVRNIIRKKLCLMIDLTKWILIMSSTMTIFLMSLMHFLTLSAQVKGYKIFDSSEKETIQISTRIFNYT